MHAARHSCLSPARVLAGALVLMASADTAGAVEKTPPSQIVVLEGVPPGRCERLGMLQGRHAGSPRLPESAKQDALEQASELGATHFQYYPEYSGRTGSITTVYSGVAYHCKVPAAPGPAPGD